ncbi:MAG: hypothetical protein AUK44_02240 [Porphyromonadaceae bacterium CG2_30_38_12]|nr:MAG: hypothetical protein AUK44_02240 [Porphyromonadaceae bacterium CG2_30_38_12]
MSYFYNKNKELERGFSLIKRMQKNGFIYRFQRYDFHIWLPTSMHFECKSCHCRRSLRSGTIMHGSKLPFLYWFKAIHLFTSTKKNFSASEMQRQLGHKRYQPI